MVMLALVQWPILELSSFCLTAICTHLVVSGGQTFLHCWLGHRRLGRALYRNHIKFHHAYYARGRLVSATYRSGEGNNTPFFLIPTVLVGVGMFFLLPLELFVVTAVVGATSFYAHVLLDKEYHVENSRLERFAWFKRKQQLHFVHHLHADRNFAVIDFFWDRLIGTYQNSETDVADLDNVTPNSRPVKTRALPHRPETLALVDYRYSSMPSLRQFDESASVGIPPVSPKQTSLCSAQTNEE